MHEHTNITPAHCMFILVKTAKVMKVMITKKSNRVVGLYFVIRPEIRTVIVILAHKLYSLNFF